MARKIAINNNYYEIRVASAGNVDAGKSTLLGVLTTNILDDGRGLARTKVFRYKHELESGRTSSVSESLISIDSCGKIIESTRQGASKAELETVPCNAYKILDFYDLAGHEKYLKTTIFGLVGYKPDYVMLVIGSNMGLVGMSKEHLGLSLALDIPVFFVLTKIDICPENVRLKTLSRLTSIIKSTHVNKKQFVIKTVEDVLTAFINLNSNKICPIFQVSCVTGENINLLKMFLSLLPRRKNYESEGSAMFCINDIYKVPGIGCVVSGVVVKGKITKSSNLLIGPNSLGDFVNPGIKSIHRKRCPVDAVYAGESASIALKKLKVEDVRKGMVLLSSQPKPVAHWQFKALVHILHHPTTISVKYQAVVHVCSVRQICAIIWMEKEVLRTGDRALIIMAFQKRPEFIVEESTVVFRDGRTKAVGIIKELLKPSMCTSS